MYKMGEEGSETLGIRLKARSAWRFCNGDLLLCVFLSQLACLAVAHQAQPPVPFPNIAGIFQNSSLQAAFTPFFGGPGDIDASSDDGNIIRLRLDSQSGSGIRSQDTLYRAFFNAAIKLPGDNSAGIVSAFYASNAEYYPNYHDEIDMEFLGVLPGESYVLQTNIYGEGSTDVGREERFHLWFDPAADFHNYSFLWTYHHIVFYVDNIPIRRFVSSSEVGLQYPSKPMKAYATIWDGSTWATHGGQYPVDYSKGPFDASFTNLKLDGCVWDPMEQSTPPECAMPNNGDWLTDSVMQEMSSDQIVALNWARTNYMWYSYCDDVLRYPTQPPPECPTRGVLPGKMPTSDDDSSDHHEHKSKSTAKQIAGSREGNATSRYPNLDRLKKTMNTSKFTDFKTFRYLPHSLWKSRMQINFLQDQTQH